MQETDGVFGTPEADKVTGLEIMRHLAVEVNARIIGLDDANLDVGLVTDHDRPVGQRMWTQRHEGDAGQRRMQDRPTRRERVGGRPGRRRDDQAVRTLVVDEFAVDRQLELDHPADCPLVHDDIVEGLIGGNFLSVTEHLRIEQHPVLGGEAPIEEIVHARQHVVARDVGHEAEAALGGGDRCQAILVTQVQGGRDGESARGSQIGSEDLGQVGLQQVVDEVATQIVLESRRSRDCGGYDAILIVGESLGGRLANAVVHQLNERGAGDKLVRPIIIDAPFDHRDFGAGGDVLAGILRIVPMGRLVNRLGLADRLFTQPAGLPQAENIANTGDLLELSCGNALTYEQYVAWVRLSAQRGLSGHKFSVYRDQLVAMATMPWYDTFADMPPIYLACTDKDTPEWQTEYAQPVEAMLDGTCPLERPANATVKQLQAAYRWMRAVPGATAWDVRIIRSTHCGYAERPLAWLDALADAVRDAVTP